MTTKNLRVLALAAMATRPMPAAAQLSRVGESVDTFVPGSPMVGTDIAWEAELKLRPTLLV